MERCGAVLRALMDHELAGPFSSPVNSAAVKGYADIIRSPMDLGTIRSKLERGAYGDDHKVDNQRRAEGRPNGGIRDTLVKVSLSNELLWRHTT